MKNSIRISAILFLFMVTTQVHAQIARSLLRPGETLKVIRNACDTCKRCNDIYEVTDANGITVRFSCVSLSGIENMFYFDSAGVCYQYEEFRPLSKDSLFFIKLLSDTTIYTKLSGDHWKETLYGRNNKPIAGCCVYWSLLKDDYRGVKLIGELEKAD